MANEINFYRLNAQNGRDCGICFDPIDGQDVAVGHLTHIYHLHCVEPWINEHHSCPECRLNVRSIQLIAPPQPPRLRAQLVRLAHQHPYLLNGIFAANTAAAIGTAALQNNHFNTGALLGLIAGTYAIAPIELELDDRLQLLRKIAIATLLCIAATIFLDSEDISRFAPISAIAARAMAEAPRLYPPLRMDHRHAPDLQSGLTLGLWSLVLATVDREDTRTSNTAITIFVVASCLATLALTAYRRFFGPGAH